MENGTDPNKIIVNLKALGLDTQKGNQKSEVVNMNCGVIEERKY